MKILDRILNKLRVRHVSDQVVFNINLRPEIENQKKALVIYLNNQFLTNNGTNDFHTSVDESTVIINSLIDHGYIVDVVDVFCDADIVFKKIKHIKYDLIFGFGELFDKLSDIKNNHANNVLYCTENHPDFSLSQELERCENYFHRHGRRVKLKRSGRFYSRLSFKGASRVISLADKSNFESFGVKTDIDEIYPTGLYNKKFSIEKKLQTKGRNFVWFGSSGAIHKGLDLLVEAFEKLTGDYKLYICGVDCKELDILKYSSKNIINLGRVNVKSESFLDIVYSCQYIILPSCSEGFSTSITTGMLHGLKPIITKDIGMNRLSDLAIFLEKKDLSVKGLKNRIESIINESAECKQEEIYNFAQENFNLISYRNQIDKIISSI
ncbi:glycosyltransferase [Vibrio vulnificus]|uniref:glycosyltransferase n=1 Tax=Vibrio vulnificus TaxID=672 RepID=UPI001CDC835E|nr:glycosyltransferase [Vibrio vulnificus]MCA3957911.1 glycosyltransferase [Vibrio vulnificus]